MARLPYFLWSLFINIAGVVVVFALAGKYRALAVQSGERNDVLALGVLATLLLLAILGLVISFSRLKNLSMSRWNILLCIVPIANIWLGFRMIACPPGYAQHKQLDLAGKVMLALFILYILLCVTVPVLFSAAGYYRAAAEQSEEMIEQQREQENAVEPME